MNINWCTNNARQRQTADVSITLSRKKDFLRIQFTNGIMATRFGNSDRIAVGFDDRDSVFCFAPCGDSNGFKVARGTCGIGRISISTKHIKDHCAPHELCGNWVLKQDKENKVSYIPIGALPR